MRTKILLAGGLALLAAGCAGDTVSDGPSAARPAPPPPVASPPPAPAGDQCGAAAAQRYVGRPRSEIPVPLLPNLQRVACTTCPVTMDFNPRRLNFLFDAESGVVREVKCG